MTLLSVYIGLMPLPLYHDSWLQLLCGWYPAPQSLSLYHTNFSPHLLPPLTPHLRPGFSHPPSAATSCHPGWIYFLNPLCHSYMPQSQSELTVFIVVVFHYQNP